MLDTQSRHDLIITIVVAICECKPTYSQRSSLFVVYLRYSVLHTPWLIIEVDRAMVILAHMKTARPTIGIAPSTRMIFDRLLPRYAFHRRTDCNAMSPTLTPTTEKMRIYDIERCYTYISNPVSMNMTYKHAIDSCQRSKQCNKVKNDS